MKKFKVLLDRVYLVTINAEDETEARRMTEFFIGDCYDLSSSLDRKENKFEIRKIEMVFNEAIESEEKNWG